MTETGSVNAGRLLLTRDDVQGALEHQIHLQVSKEPGAARTIGTVVAAAARDSGYRTYSGSVRIEDTDRPVAVGSMGLVFDSNEKAARTFSQVAAAAHLRTKLGESSVAVETVTSANGLVSYWGFLHLRECIVIVTLDTIDPQVISMTDFRGLVSRAAERLQRTAA